MKGRMRWPTMKSLLEKRSLNVVHNELLCMHALAARYADLARELEIYYEQRKGREYERACDIIPIRSRSDHSERSLQKTRVY